MWNHALKFLTTKQVYNLRFSAINKYFLGYQLNIVLVHFKFHSFS